ncbi:pyridoxal 5'-phosphate synthase (plasmid) [Rhizobium leguminosarum]|uniref:pyridoxal 5'-phosphate synthase n=1 Tax=Rhizobium leguminosarum TaxID=384 RepID=UPI000487A819|nr:pyridoxal 5'-phosphate synthase [Rhizobium leguminosarum]UIK01241.1 pyridoxal 5'-phosphate synthase [Rhizobium leguminosarum]UIK14162.1 pyridoxal 5'-phosphate synthase [Rhizobium leguminosarum]UIL30287.1 pyridoxal 5'-phosphate synthase [Rhizobium leguminosarum]WFT90936.1 pyridoxal 5'-phosphate synthase [Rhizobium leguminosarum]
MSDTTFASLPSESMNPIDLIKIWYDGAVANDVRDPAVMALATADSLGHASNRVIRILHFQDNGLVFTTHAGSLKGRQIAQTGWSSGVMYWPELGQQVIVSGPTGPLPDADSDALWDARAHTTHPMSTVSRQSEPLRGEADLRARAKELEHLDRPLPRPFNFKGYLIEPAAVEFWQIGRDRLHLRLRYTQRDRAWHAEQLQP